MIIFGQVKNITVEQTRTVKHLGARKFIPVFDRTFEDEVYKYPTGASFEKIKKIFSRYERWGGYWWTVSPTSKPKTLWSIARIKRKRIGQRDFFEKILKEN